MPSENQARKSICEVGRLLYERGHIVAGEGNISMRMGDAILITPSGVCKGRMEPSMLVRCNMDGKVLPGDTSGRHPSSEIAMHVRVYRERSDVAAVVHAHPVAATARAACRKSLEGRFLSEQIAGIGPIPLCSFAMPSTEAVAESIAAHVHASNGVLLANHGALAWGADIWQAFDRMETIEHLAKIYAQAESMGGGVALKKNQTAQLCDLQDFYRRQAEVLKPVARKMPTSRSLKKRKVDKPSPVWRASKDRSGR